MNRSPRTPLFRPLAALAIGLSVAGSGCATGSGGTTAGATETWPPPQYTQLLNQGESLWSRQDFAGARDIFMRAAEIALGRNSAAYQAMLRRSGQSGCMIQFRQLHAQTQRGQRPSDESMDAFLNNPHCPTLQGETVLVRQWRTGGGLDPANRP